MIISLIAALSPAHPSNSSKGFDPVSLAFSASLGLVGIYFSAQMIFRPNHFIESQENRLQRLEYDNLNYQLERRATKISTLRRFLYNGNPILKARIQGCIILLVIILFELLIWSEDIFAYFNK
jgi:hypothetical protein